MKGLCSVFWLRRLSKCRRVLGSFGPRLSTCLLAESVVLRLCSCRLMDSRGPAARYWCLLVDSLFQ